MNFEVEPLSAVDIEIAMAEIIEFAYSQFGEEIWYDQGLDFDYIIEAIYLKTGYRFVPREMPKYCEGLTLFNDRTFSISKDEWNSMDDNARARFSLAHEIAHVVLHGKQSDSFDLKAARNSGRVPAYRDSEWQANTGAAALLAPYKQFSKELGRLDRIYMREKEEASLLSTMFHISKECAQRRIRAIREYQLDNIKASKLRRKLRNLRGGER